MLQQLAGFIKDGNVFKDMTGLTAVKRIGNACDGKNFSSTHQNQEKRDAQEKLAGVICNFNAEYFHERSW